MEAGLGVFSSTLNIQGPVVQSVVSLTSSLRVISLTVLADLTLKAPRKPASETVVCLSSAEYSCKLFKPIFTYRQTVWTQIRLLLKEQSDLGPHCLQK